MVNAVSLYAYTLYSSSYIVQLAGKIIRFIVQNSRLGINLRTRSSE